MRGTVTAGHPSRGPPGGGVGRSHGPASIGRVADVVLSVRIGTAPEGAVAPGDRAPDGPLEDGSRLFRVLGTVHVLLLFGATDADRIRVGTLLDDHRTVLPVVGSTDLANTYGAERGAALLIRPDGHVSIRCDPLDIDAVLHEHERRFVDGAPPRHVYEDPASTP